MDKKINAKLIKILNQCIVPVLVFGLLLLFDQLSKLYFINNYEEFQKSPEIINGFFRFYYVRNEGAAFSFLSNKDWAQTFFIILTPIVTCGFIAYYVLFARKRVFVRFAMVLIISGTIGNFIDRVSYNYVVDFLSFTIFGSDFATFNLADTYLVIGVIMVLFFYLFLDEDSVFKLVKNFANKNSTINNDCSVDTNVINTSNQDITNVDTETTLNAKDDKDNG
jgi:signal peptidase II